VAKAKLRPDNRAVLVYEPTAPAEIAQSAEDAEGAEDPESAATVEATDENEEAAK
ncbi:MAG: peptidase M16, partial [Streptomyces sp.]|nr:peptidase M16 [Streptomyces sp.]